LHDAATTEKAWMNYYRPPDRWSAQFLVELVRGAEGWTVSDATGVVDLNCDNASARRAFAFVKGKGVSRYLTSAEMDDVIGGKRSIEQVLSEMRVSDNAPGNR